MLHCLQVVHVILVVFIIIAGFVTSNPANAQPFFPYEIRGVFNVSKLQCSMVVCWQQRRCRLQWILAVCPPVLRACTVREGLQG